MNAMPAASPASRPMWFWIISILALLWNLMGVAAFVMQMSMSPEAMAALPESQQELFETRPAWALAAFVVAVFAGVLGSLMLVLKNKLALPLLVLSLLGVIGQMTHMFLLSNTFDVRGQPAMVLPLLIIFIAVFLAWFARLSVRRGLIS